MSRKEYIFYKIFWMLIAIALFIISSYAINNHNKSQKLFSPKIPNDKFILVKGWNEIQLKKILSEFKKNCQKQGYPTYSVEIHKEDKNEYQITFPQDVHPLLFIFLINYLAYPFDVEKNKEVITVAGESTLDSDYRGLSENLMRQKAIFYIPENDKRHDIVYMVTNRGEGLSLSLSTGYWEKIDDKGINKIAKELLVHIMQKSQV